MPELLKSSRGHEGDLELTLKVRSEYPSQYTLNDRMRTTIAPAQNIIPADQGKEGITIMTFTGRGKVNQKRSKVNE